MKIDQPTAGVSPEPAGSAISLAASETPRYCLPRQGRAPCRRFPVAMRLVILGAGATLLSLLAVARILTPDPSGHGTHRQLGLPPCTFVALFGKTCPSCGMTTSWAHLMRGDFRRAVAANAGGALLGLSAIVAAPWLIISAYAGRWLLARPHEWVLIGYAFLLAAVIVTDWWIKTGGLF